MEKKLTYKDLVQRVNELEKDKLELKRAEETLRLIAEDTARLTGKEFIRSLVKQLASVIGFRWVFVGKLVAPDSDCVNTLVFWADGDYAENFKYDLSGTPCQNVVEQSFRFYPKDIQSKYPQDQLLVEMGVESYMGIPLINSSGNTIGLLVAMHDNSMEKLVFAKPIMNIFAERIVAEIERLQAEKIIERKQQKQEILNIILKNSLKPNSLKGILNYILDQITSIPWFAFKSKAAIFLVEDKPDVLVLKAFQEFSKDALVTCGKISFGECLCGLAAKTKEIIFADHIVRRHEIVYKGISSHGHYCVPILSESKVRGVLTLYVKEGHQSKKEEENFLMAIANVLTGIIERKRAEDELIKSNKKFQNMCEVTSDIVWELNKNAIYTYVNPDTKKILGYKPEEIIGKTFFDFLHPDEAERMTKLFSTAAAKREPFINLEKTIIHKKGFQVNLESSGVPTFDEMGIFKGYHGIDRDITKRKQAEEKLKKAHEKLEEIVIDRTAELSESNKQLRTEIAERTQAEKELKKREEELRSKTKNLEETNIALNVLLKKREEDKSTIEKNVFNNVQEMVFPYLAKLKKRKLDDRTNSYLHIIESNLNNIISSFSHKITSKHLNLTPTEMQIANLIKQGSNTKEIAEILCLSDSTIGFHRKNLRKKLRIKNKKVSLRTKLISCLD